ncbi:MAG: flagellar FlbD family protein [Brevinema sp.]
MVELTRLNGSKIMINPYLVEIIESNPDTTILMNSGKKYLVSESPQDIEKRFSNFLAGSFYKALVHSGAKISTQPLSQKNKEN